MGNFLDRKYKLTQKMVIILDGGIFGWKMQDETKKFNNFGWGIFGMENSKGDRKFRIIWMDDFDFIEFRCTSAHNKMLLHNAITIFCL